MRSPIVVKDRETGEPKYTITKGRDGRWWCTCMSYKYGNHLVDGSRSCKHIERYVPSETKSTTRRKKQRLDVLELKVLPETFDSYKGCWISEKMDGVFIRHSNGKFYTRSGRVVQLPKHLTKSIPKDHEIDFELWCGRGNFSLATRVVNEGYRPPKGDVQLVAFDLMTKGSYSKRYTALRALSNEYGFEVVEQFESDGPDDVVTVYSEICANGGEGIVIRDVESDTSTRYESGRSKSTAYKYKGAWIGHAYAVEPAGQGKWIFIDESSGARFAMKIPRGHKVHVDSRVEFVSGFHPNNEPYRAAMQKVVTN